MRKLAASLAVVASVTGMMILTGGSALADDHEYGKCSEQHSVNVLTCTDVLGDISDVIDISDVSDIGDLHIL